LANRRIKIAEEVLVTLLKDKDERGFSILYDNYSAALMGILYKIVRSEELAADLLQEVFVKIWKNVGSYEPGKGTLFTWMLNIARNTAIDKTRSQVFRQGQQNQSIENTVHLHEPVSHDHMSVQTDMIGLEKGIALLRPEYQQLIDLIYFQGFTQVEAAEELNIPLGTVKTRIKAAVVELREWVGE
jgi:RNA polymerase sigma-70 factor, ECF subfamily